MTKKQPIQSRRTFLSNVAIIGASGSLVAGSLLSSCSGNGANGSRVGLHNVKPIIK